MFPIIKTMRVIVFTAALAVTSISIAEDQPVHSGYLSEEVYSKLEKVELKNGAEAMRWLGPKLNFANYQKILIDDVVLYPEPEPGPQVSAETLEQVKAYLTEKLDAKVRTVVNVTTEPGPGVLRMHTAVTGVEIKTEGMKAYEVVPVAAIFGGVKALTGTRDRDVHVFVEVKFSDSQSGEVIGAALRKIEGKKLKGKKDQLELKDMQKSLDKATDDAQSALSEALAKPE